MAEQRWSYQIVEVQPKLFSKHRTAALQEHLSRMGNQGWELVQVLQHSSLDVARMLFKRPT